MQGYFKLSDCLTWLEQWCSDAKVYTEALLNELRSLSQSINIETDKIIVQKQLHMFQRCCKLDENFYMTRAACLPHISKYHENSLYKTNRDMLYTISDNNND